MSRSMSDGNQTVRIDDDSKTLSIKVKVKNAEKPVDYDRKFDVRNLSDKQKENLTNAVLDSLGIKI